LSPSAVSEFLAGKRKFSQKISTRVMDSLAVSPSEQQVIINAFETNTKPKTMRSTRALEALPNKLKRILTDDEFRIVTEWYHFAILSLFETTTTDANIEFVMTRLGITKRQAESALQRLCRIGALRETTQNHYEVTGEQLETTQDVPSSAIQASHVQTLELAHKAITEVPVELREVTSMTMAVDLSTLPQAKELIRNFCTDLASIMETSDKNEVYMFGVQLFPLTKGEIT
jgi:uncharacterized protein (TIGR02147 family)